MKKQLNSAGVAQVQAQLLTLPDAELRAETELIRVDFSQWMESQFELGDSQIEQLQDMSKNFQAYLGMCIADALEQRSVIAFSKGEPTDEEELPQNKDILIFRQSRVAWSTTTNKMQHSEGLSIEIAYR